MSQESSDNIVRAWDILKSSCQDGRNHTAVSFGEFLEILQRHPDEVLRNIFQLFHDMILTYVVAERDEYPGDPESINFVKYDCERLFIAGADRPFFADRLFANRFVNLMTALRRGARQNKIYMFEGPPGCGKSTFLNNLLRKLEEYTNTDIGVRYEALWRLDVRQLGGFREAEALVPGSVRSEAEGGEYVEVPCPSHDNPMLVIPKDVRRDFLDGFFRNDQFKYNLFTEKEYEWVFRDTACTICSSLYQALLERLGDAQRVFAMLYARQYRFNRRLGEGISVFNPGDKPIKQIVVSNPQLQQRIDGLLRDSNQVRYIFSHFARTNGGVYALMDIKSHNVERLTELHNIISEGVHKVEDIEENVNSLFMALMNPEDKNSFDKIQSFSDRIETVRIPYVLDLKTEVEIYRNIFGRHIDENFLPKVLHNFARVVISTRLNRRSEAMLEWIPDPDKYKRYCDRNLQLLKMEIYTGHIPRWLAEDDLKRFNAQRRRRIIAESETEGEKGFSGRDSIRLFGEFYTSYARENKVIDMSMLVAFFHKLDKQEAALIPDGFLDSLLWMYNYHILQEVKESLYYFNEEQITRDILNYMFAVNFEPGTVVRNQATGDRLEISDSYFEALERQFLGRQLGTSLCREFRRDVQKEYATRTLTQEMGVEGRRIQETRQYKTLFEKYEYNLKERVLEPFLENENFRRAIKDYDTEAFKTYDRKIRDDVTFLIGNLIRHYRYSPLGAKEVCIYVIDNDLARKFTPH